MINLNRVDVRLFDTISPVIEELTRNTPLIPENVLLIGAGSRDIIHSALGHAFEVRSTSDADIAIAVDDWKITERIDALYPKSGSNGIRYIIAKTPSGHHAVWCHRGSRRHQLPRTARRRTCGLRIPGRLQPIYHSPPSYRTEHTTATTGWVRGAKNEGLD